MKNSILVILALLVSGAIFGQSKSVAAFETKYKNDRDALYVTVSGSLFGFMASVGSETDDEDAQALAKVAKNIRGMRVISVPKFEANLEKSEIDALKSAIDKENFKPLFDMREGQKSVKIVAQGAENEMNNVLVLVDEKEKFTILIMDGTLSSKDLSWISQNHEKLH